MLTAIIIYYYHPKFLIYFADAVGVGTTKDMKAGVGKIRVSVSDLLISS